MSSEFYIIFENIYWYYTSKDKIKQKIMSLETFICILLGITMHPANIEKDLKEFCNWFRLNTIIKIQDEYFNISNW